MAHILLIADLHLIPDKTNKINLFIKFCQEHASKVLKLILKGLLLTLSSTLKSTTKED